MHPNWLGSPQHVIGGAAVAVAVVIVARRWIPQPWLLATLAIGIAATAELLVEVVEYPLLYSGHIHASAYYDTIADLASTLVGAVLGGMLSFARVRDRHDHARQRP